MNVIVIGASGYTGAELCRLVVAHPDFNLQGAFVSINSIDKDRDLAELYPCYPQLTGISLKPFAGPADISDLKVDLAFLATPHELSHRLAPQLIAAGVRVADLSGAFRIKDAQTFAKAYGFEHEHAALLQASPYGLVDFYADEMEHAELVAVPGCYPTAALLALKPVAAMLDSQFPAVINAISGVSGAGRKSSMSNSFCEVGMQAYGVLNHRHQPEIASWLGHPVVFTPHLGTYKRGILATCTVRMKAQTSCADITHAYQQAYAGSPLISVKQDVMPKLDEVVHSPRCHIGWRFDEQQSVLVVSSVIDNLLKGAASQALQAANLMNKLNKDKSL